LCCMTTSCNNSMKRRHCEDIDPSELCKGCRCEHIDSGRRGTVEWVCYKRMRVLIQYDAVNQNPSSKWFGYEDDMLEVRKIYHRRIT
jgi:hypothetical protein